MPKLVETGRVPGLNLFLVNSGLGQCSWYSLPIHPLKPKLILSLTALEGKERMERSYSQQYSHLWHHHWWWQSRHRMVMGWVERLMHAREGKDVAPVPAILDIGCGGGWSFRDLAHFGEVDGIEPDADLSQSEPRWRGRIQQQAFGRGHQVSKHYDLVLMLDVLEHIEDDGGALQSLWHLLKPGGHAIITVPALMWLWNVHDEVNHHYRRYHQPELTQLLAHTGFEIVDSRHAFFWSLGLLYLQRRVLTSKGSQYQVSPPGFWVNTACRWLTNMENALVNLLGLHPPLGSSLVAIVRRPGVARAQCGPPSARHAA